MQLNNCPDDFYSSCLNATKSCERCCAGFGNPKSPLMYLPAKDSPFTLIDHPDRERQIRDKKDQQQQAKSRDVAASKRVRAGLRSEKVIADKIIKQTVRSGAKFGDGDYQSLEGLIQCDHKLRTRTKNFVVSWDEYNKGIRQGTNQWMITVTEYSKPHTLVCLTMDVYTKLLALAINNIQEHG